MIAIEVVADVSGFKVIVLRALYDLYCNKTNGRQINRKSWPKSRLGCRPRR